MRARGRAVLAALVAAVPVALVAGAPGDAGPRTYRIVPGRGKITVNVQTEGLVGENQGPVGPGRAVDPRREKVLIDGKLPQPHALSRPPSRSPYDSRPKSPVRGLTLEARDYRGSIVYDPAQPRAVRVEVRVPVRSLEPVAPSLEGEDRSEVIDWLRSSWVLDVARSPEISFVGSGAHFRGSAGGGFVNAQVSGRLEIHHRSNPVSLAILAKLTDEGVEVIGRHQVTLRSFDVLPLRDRTGVYRLRRDVEVDFHVTAVPEAQLELGADEVHPPELTGRAEHAGELTGQAPETAPLTVPEEPDLKVPAEPELRIPEEADLRGRAWLPEERLLLPNRD